MKNVSNTALRHAPKQVRGQRKVEHILRVAEALFAEVGFENATTNAVAARAGVSIGSLYQFFSGKEAILEALAGRYLTQMRQAMGAMFAADGEYELDGFLTSVLEIAVKLQEQRPYFLQCLTTLRPSPSPVIASLVDDVTDELSVGFAKLLQRGTTETDSKLVRLRARVCVGVMTGVLPLAVYTRGRERAQVIAEVKDMMVRYLAPTLKVQGVI